MTQINTPFILSKIRPRNEFSGTQNNYFDQLERIIQQLYRRVGGSIDIVEEIEMNMEVGNHADRDWETHFLA